MIILIRAFFSDTKMFRAYNKNRGTRQSQIQLRFLAQSSGGGSLCIREASGNYAVPYITLKRWLKFDNLLSYGRPPALNNLEEDKLVQLLQLLPTRRL